MKILKYELENKIAAEVSFEAFR